MRTTFPHGFPVMPVVLAPSVCSDGSDEDPGPGAPSFYLLGDASVYTVGGVSFTTRYAPLGQFESDVHKIAGMESFPSLLLGSSPFWMAETEATYRLWKAVNDYVQLVNAKGFHLPVIGEGEFAARYLDGTIRTPGSMSAGAQSTIVSM
jgi:hypothetical protein